MDLIAHISPRDDQPALLRQWFKFYRRHGVERFHLFVSQDLAADGRWQEIRELLSAPDITRVATYEGLVADQVRADRFSDYSASELGQRPCVLVADSDEFISNPAHAARLMREHGYDYIPGMLVDRFELRGRTLPIDDEIDLANAFPLCTHFTFNALAGNIGKVPVARPGLRYRVGNHSVENPEALRAPGWWIAVDHFKWHAGVVGKIRERIARGNACGQYLEECRRLLDRFVIDDDHIDVSRIPSWLRPGW